MNDDFLTRLRKPPPREFAAELYQRINTSMNTQRNSTFRRFAFAAAICLTLVGALAFSPGVRAAFNHLILEIAGVTYVSEEELKSSVPASPRPEVITPEDILSIAEAQSELPYEISLPTWTPDGFVLGASVRVSYFENGFTPAIITWYGSDPEIGHIELMIGQRVNWLVDLESVREIQLNGQPAALVGGTWDEETGQWNEESNLSLTWMRGDAMYKLSAPGLPAADLIRMAESIP